MMSRRRGRTVLAAIAVIMVVIGAGIVAGRILDAAAKNWRPSAAQIAIATATTHDVAGQTVPTADGTPDPAPTVDTTGWPATVRTITMVATVLGAALAVTDAPISPASGAYGQTVFVVQLTGAFSVQTSPTTHSTGPMLTIIIDARFGFLTNVDVGGPAQMKTITGGYPLFERR